MKSDASLDIKTLSLDIHAQPNDETCGPTCLHAVYSYFGDQIKLDTVIDEVTTLHTGGTLAVMLANHALKKGYEATIYTYNLHVFDPTWFQTKVDLVAKLEAQLKAKPQDERVQTASRSYIQFLKNGGEIAFKELNKKLIKDLLKQRLPILTGLSATFLYDCAREIGALNTYDDVKGEPTGHFVIIHGYDDLTKLVAVADPLAQNPMASGQHYDVKLDRLIHSILLGIVTYDANLLVIKPQ